MVLQIELTTDQLKRLEEKARRSGMPLNDLARKTLVALANEPSADFKALARQIAQENAELLKRLA